MTKTLKEIAVFLQGELTGDGSIAIRGVNSIEDAQPGEIAFAGPAVSEKTIEGSGASCVVVGGPLQSKTAKPLIKVDSPSVAFSRLVDLLMPERIPVPKGVHGTAIAGKKAVLGKDVALGQYVVVEDGASIGDNTVLYPFCFVGKNTKIGAGCIIYPNVTIREEVSIGNRVVIHPGSVIGSDGFGYDTQRDGTHVKIPQIGTVLIEDDVEIGACVTIDRARFSKTVIGKGSKIDNLVQIAHNVVIGPYCLAAAQTGISGSTSLGRNVVLGGQVGVADHLKLGDFVMAGAKTGISKSFPANTTLFWYPAKPVDKARDILGCVGLLPKLYERVKVLEAKIKELESK
ncbi:MAG: UDP-3-O-(3-hydroxymyristoyl)glucosamine N-acyltransferase [Candidatus Omnitrophica bacterium]|nr:UDP-3-O-(3-hydroxymyristoyl)glucosamine N-acyltransferase [Candidatus Omnitrophota bacterium]